MLRSSTFSEKPQVSMLPNANMDRRTTEYSTQTALVTSLGFRKPPYSCTQGMFHSPHVHPTSRYVIASDKFYQAFSRVSTQATNARVVTRLGSSHNAVHVNFTSLMVSSLEVVQQLLFQYSACTCMRCIPSPDLQVTQQQRRR